MSSTDSELWMSQLWRWWWHMRMDTAEIARVSGRSESSVEKDLHVIMDARWKQAQEKR